VLYLPIPNWEKKKSHYHNHSWELEWLNLTWTSLGTLIIIWSIFQLSKSHSGRMQWRSTLSLCRVTKKPEHDQYIFFRGLALHIFCILDFWSRSGILFSFLPLQHRLERVNLWSAIEVGLDEPLSSPVPHHVVYKIGRSAQGNCMAQQCLESHGMLFPTS
jgi:hypothetical protein